MDSQATGVQPQIGTRQSAPPFVSEQQSVLPTSHEHFPKSFLNIFLVALLVLFLVGGGVVGYFSLKKSETGEAVSQTAGSSADTKRFRESFTQYVGEGQQIVFQSIPHYVGNQSITLHNVTGENYSGTAIRSIIPFNILYAVYTNLPGPPEGAFYQVWRVKSESDIRQVNRLYDYRDGTYSTTAHESLDSSSLYFRTFDDLYNTLVISLETVDDDVMETKILEGTFTQ